MRTIFFIVGVVLLVIGLLVFFIEPIDDSTFEDLYGPNPPDAINERGSGLALTAIGLLILISLTT